MTNSKNSGKDSLTKKNESTTLSRLATVSGMSNSAIKLSYFTGNSDWIIDSGAMDHITCNRYRFSHLSSKSSKITITNANGVSSPVIGIGTIPLSPTLTIKDVLFVPSQNLIFSLLKTRLDNQILNLFLYMDTFYHPLIKH